MAKKQFLYSLILCTFCLCQTSFPTKDFPQKLSNALDDHKGFYVITITRDQKILDTLSESRIAYAPKPPLNNNEIEKILNEIDKLIAKIDNNAPVFVIFNEFFFSRNTLENDRYNEILEKIKKRSTKHWNAIYYVNFIYKLDGSIASFVDNLKIYTENIHPLLEAVDLNWEISSCSDTLRGNPNTAFANETSVVFFGQIISKYRKSTYCAEDDTLLSQQFTYFHGFGYDEIVHNLTGIHEKIAKVLHQKVYTDICWDIQKRIRTAQRYICNNHLLLTRNSENTAKIEKLRSLIQNQYIETLSFKLHIIQSDTTNISSVMPDLLLDKQVLVQSDPSVVSCNKMLHSNLLKEYIVDASCIMIQKIKSADSALNDKKQQDYFRLKGEASTFMTAISEEIQKNCLAIQNSSIPCEKLKKEFTREDDDGRIAVWFSLFQI